MFDKVNKLALSHFTKLSRPITLPSGAENTWYIELTLEPSDIHESDRVGKMTATLWDESINAPAGSTPIRLFGTAALWVGDASSEKFTDITSFISMMFSYCFAGSYYCLDNFSRPNDVFRESDFWVTVPYKIIMPDVKLGELVMAFLESFSSVKSKSWSVNFGAKKREDPERKGQTIVACSQCRYIGTQQAGPCPWRKLARCSGCSTAF